MVKPLAQAARQSARARGQSEQIVDEPTNHLDIHHADLQSLRVC